VCPRVALGMACWVAFPARKCRAITSGLRPGYGESQWPSLPVFPHEEIYDTGMYYLDMIVEVI
jgi:hypothetical protein